MIPDINNNINLLFTNIGRGHPFYLDGIIEALIKKQSISLIKNENDVFKISHGTSLLAWKTARWMYYKGSSPGILRWFYNKIRTPAAKQTMAHLPYWKPSRSYYLPDILNFGRDEAICDKDKVANMKSCMLTKIYKFLGN